MLDEIRQLAKLRLDRNWTYDRLALAVGLKRATVYRILTTSNPRIHDLTRHRIQQYLQRQGMAA